MRLCEYAADGGVRSGVRALYIIEIKSLFSIVLLHFSNGTREAYHSHAFNAITWFLKGSVREHRVDPDNTDKVVTTSYCPSIKPKVTVRNNHHKVESFGDTLAISFRGPWRRTWREFLPQNNSFITLTNGRKIVG